MKIFGYASLMSANGINEHDLPEKFHTDELTTAVLKDHKRSWNAFDGKYRYLGVTKQEGARINGVLFSIKPGDLPKFNESEGVPTLYNLKDVTNYIEPRQSDKVFTLVTNSPTKKGNINEGYRRQVEDAAASHGKEFSDEFYRTTPEN